MFRSWAASVKLADETKEVLLSMTTHLAWRTALRFESRASDSGIEVNLWQSPICGPVLVSEAICESGDELTVSAGIAEWPFDIQKHLHGKTMQCSVKLRYNFMIVEEL
jgi:hypothetical protein